MLAIVLLKSPEKNNSKSGIFPTDFIKGWPLGAADQKEDTSVQKCGPVLGLFTL